jgi:integrase
LDSAKVTRKRTSATKHPKFHAAESGAQNAQARRNQLLPLAWQFLTDTEILEITDAIERILSQENSLVPIRRLEAALAASAIISTGRSLAELHQINLVVAKPVAAVPEQPALLLIDSWCCWHLRSARPRGTPDTSSICGEKAHVRTEFVSLQASDHVSRSVQRLAERRQKPSQRLFKSSEESLDREIKHILRHRRCSTHILCSKSKTSLTRSCRPHPRRTSCTVEALERWPTSAVLHRAGGDLGVAAAVTGADESTGRTVSYYCTVSAESARGFHREAIGTRIAREYPPLKQIDRGGERTGGSWTPKDAAVDKLAEEIRLRFSSAADPVEQHNAMTDFTVMLLCFALGLRGNSTKLPTSSAIEHQTGFCILHDKDVADAEAARLSWVPPVARSQIKAYERHLRIVGSRVFPPQADAVLTRWRTNPAELPLFEFSAGSVRFLNLGEVLQRFSGTRSYEWKLPPNAGRHWLRNKLVGLCSTETLHAFFGHWQTGTHSWAKSSCLDPQAYRADLERSLPKVLAKVGWDKPLQVPATETLEAGATAPRGSGKPHPMRLFQTTLGGECRFPPSLGRVRENLAPNVSTNPHLRMGQLLLSAILNGALLAEREWHPWINAVSEWNGFYLDLFADGNGTKIAPAKRWFPDSTTKRLLDHWSKCQLAEIELDERAVDRCLSDFFQNLKVQPIQGKADLLRYAEYSWSLKLPPLLLEHALGRVQTVCIPQRDWERLNGRNVPWADRRSGGGHQDHFDDFWRTFSGEAKALFGPWNDYREGRIGLLRAKRESAERLEHLLEKTHVSPGRAVLIQWGIAMLRAKRRRPHKTGYAHYTVREYMTQVAFELYPDVIDTGEFRIDRDDLRFRLQDKLAHPLELNVRRKISAAAALLRRFIESPEYLSSSINYKTPSTIFLGAKEVVQGDQIDVDFESGERIADRMPSWVSANLVTPFEFEKAFASTARRSWEENDVALCLTLGFRAGLRLPEIVGLRLSDFRAAGAVLELDVQRHDRRELKNFNSRRIVPLDVLLEDQERGILEDRLNTLRAHSLATGIDPYLLGPVGGRRVPPFQSYETKANEKLAAACGKNAGIRFNHLRHSFVSYLLATLLLPSGIGPARVQKPLQSVVSPVRRKRVANRLLGDERLGQSALYAVSQIVGHAGVNMTLSTYAHLLDLSLNLFVLRHHNPDDVAVIASDSTSANAPDEVFAYRAPILSYPDPARLRAPTPGVRKRDTQEAWNELIGEVQRLSDVGRTSYSESLLPSPPQWRAFYDVVSTNDDAVCESSVQAYNLQEKYVPFWRRDYQTVLQHCTKRQGECYSLTLPQGADAVNLVSSLWSGIFSTIREEIKNGLRKEQGEDIRKQTIKKHHNLIASYLAHFDNKRSFARFPSASKALESKDLLVTSGLKPTDIAVMDSKSYDAAKKATDAKREIHSPGILERYWAFKTKEHAECARELRAVEAERGPISTIVALTVGSRWPSRSNRLWKSEDAQENESSYIYRPVRQLNYAVRFTLLLFAAFHGLDVRRRTVDSTKNLRPKRSVADLRAP